MSSKFVKNIDNAMIVCRVTSDKNKVFHFTPKKFDKRNNVMLSNGFTEISDSDIALLEAESSVFKYYSAKGLLTITDILPHEAMSTDQLVNALKSENAMLKKELKKIKDSGASMSLEAAEDYTARINELGAELTEKHKKLEQLKKKVEEQEKIIEALDEQITFAAEENNTEKKEG